MPRPLANSPPQYAAPALSTETRPAHPVWAAIAPELTPRDFTAIGADPGAMDAGALRLFSKIRRRAGVPFRIRSAYRPPARNAAAGGASASEHMNAPCTAIDLHVRNNYERFRIVQAAIMEGIERIGIYPAAADNSGSVHIDCGRHNPTSRIWTRY